MRRFLAIAVFLVFAPFVVGTAHAANRDVLFVWSQVCSTVEGDDLDLNDDGVCEQMEGFRFYTNNGDYITGITETGIREHSVRMNLDWGRACFQMTSTMIDPVNGSIIESAFSNEGACIDVVPGRPTPPVVIR